MNIIGYILFLILLQHHPQLVRYVVHWHDFVISFIVQQYNFPVTSGSDIHNINAINPDPTHLNIGGMEFDSPLIDVFDYAERIKFNKGRIIKS